MNEIQHLIKEINAFRDARDWKDYHNPKDLAISISLEASELLEDFQWKTSEEALEENAKNIEEELADILIYSLSLCSDLDLDVASIIRNKMKKNAEKYPLPK